MSGDDQRIDMERGPRNRLGRCPSTTDAVGKEYPPATYEVGREKIREYANAVGERPTRSTTTARPPQAAGFRDVVAPPMFCVVYSARRWARRSSTPRSGSTSRRWSTAARSSSGASRSAPATRSRPTVEVTEIYEKDGKGFYVFESVSTNQDGDEVVRGTWTNIVRGV